MSVVFYKFKSAKDYDTCTFDGTNISVFDLKREIMLGKKLGKGTDFDLVIYNAQTNEEYKDDMYMIPRNTSVLVSRHPASKPGKGTAQRYLTTAMPTGAMLGGSRARAAPQPAPSLPKHHSLNNRAPQQKPNGVGEPPASEIIGETEEERIANMFKLQTEQWAVTQDKMAQQRPIPRQYPGGGRGGWRGGHQHSGGDRASHQAGADGNQQQGGWQQRDFPQRAPPPGYICYRCGQKGHFINQCPTIGDQTFDRPKLKRTTGIPKIFLKVVDEKQAATGGVMVTQNGELVVAQPNEQAWAVQTARTRNYLGAGDVHEMAPVPDELACPLCKKLLRDAVLIPCCGTSYCDECIRTHLLENEDPEQGLKCPNCGHGQSPDNLVPNKSLRQAVEHHIRDFAAKKTTAPASPQISSAVAVATPLAATSRSASPVVSAASISAAPAAAMTTAPLPQPPVIPVIQRKAPVEKPYKIIAPAKKEPDSVVTDASPAAPAPSNGPIRKVEPAVRNGLKRPHEDTVDGVDGEYMEHERRRSFSRFPDHPEDFGPYPPYPPHRGGPPMMPPPDFDPRWGPLGPGHHMMPHMYGRWDGPHPPPPHMFPPYGRRMGYGPPPPMGPHSPHYGPPPHDFYEERWRREGSRDRGGYPPSGSQPVSSTRPSSKRPRDSTDVIDVTSKSARVE